MKTKLALAASGKPVSTQSRQEAKAQGGIISGLALLSPNIIAFCKDFTGARNLFRVFQGQRTTRGINSALLWLRLSRVKPLLLCVLALIPSALPAATNDLSELLQKGLF